jgi:hypothetical protein
MKQGEGVYSEAERRRMVEQEQHFVAHPDAYRSAQSESEAAQLRKERMLRECSKQVSRGEERRGHSRVEQSGVKGSRTEGGSPDLKTISRSALTCLHLLRFPFVCRCHSAFST